jgi:beta-lactamase regulating signal transducer with metallopeptidase domain
MILRELHSLVSIDSIGIWLFHFVLLSSVIALITSVILFIFKNISAQLKYCICFLSLLLMILLPSVTSLLDFYENNFKVFTAPTKILSPVKAKEVFIDGKYIATQYRKNEFFLVSDEEIITRIGSYLPYITSAWLIGVFLNSLYHLFGFYKLRKLVRKIQQNLEPFWESRFQSLILKLNIKRKIIISKLPGLEAPVIIGCLKPILFLPLSFFSGMNNEYIEAIILHELAHIKRYDYLFNMIQVMIEILGFFHPAVWWLSKKIREERENCCDDVAIKITGDRLIYVKALVQLEECRDKNKLILAANGGNLFCRTTRILKLKESRNSSLFLNISEFFITLLFFFLITGFMLKQNGEILKKINIGVTNKNFVKNFSQNLIAYYPFNGNANDESGFKQDGLIYNASLTEDRAGRAGKAFDFNGKDSYILIPKTTALNTNGSITVSCWIFPRKIVNCVSWVAKLNSLSSASQWRVGFGEDINHEWGLTECHLKDKKNIWTDYWITKNSIKLNRWTQVTVVADQAAGFVFLYVNGRKIVQFDNLKSFEESQTPLLIGFQKDNLVYFNGKIDDIRIYNRALNEQEVNVVYNLN